MTTAWTDVIASLDVALPMATPLYQSLGATTRAALAKAGANYAAKYPSAVPDFSLGESTAHAAWKSAADASKAAQAKFVSAAAGNSAMLGLIGQVQSLSAPPPEPAFYEAPVGTTGDQWSALSAAVAQAVGLLALL